MILKQNLIHGTIQKERINLYNFKRVNKKSLGFFKDELNGKLVTEFVGLCAKVYCYRIDQVESSHNKASEFTKSYN